MVALQKEVRTPGILPARVQDWSHLEPSSRFLEGYEIESGGLFYSDLVCETVPIELIGTHYRQFSHQEIKDSR